MSQLHELTELLWKRRPDEMNDDNTIRTYLSKKAKELYKPSAIIHGGQIDLGRIKEILGLTPTEQPVKIHHGIHCHCGCWSEPEPEQPKKEWPCEHIKKDKETWVYDDNGEPYYCGGDKYKGRWVICPKCKAERPAEVVEKTLAEKLKERMNYGPFDASDLALVAEAHFAEKRGNK